MRLVEALLLILTILYVLTFGLLSKNMNHFNGHITIQSQSPASLGKPEETDSFESANRQSFGFFYDIPESNWKRLQQIFNEHVNHLHPEKPFVYHPQSQEHQSIPQVYVNRRGHSGWNSYAAWYQSNYEPNFSCQFERRIGGTGNGDGPKWVCDPHRIRKLAKERRAKDPSHPGCVVYSVGSNGDFSFELGKCNLMYYMTGMLRIGMLRIDLYLQFCEIKLHIQECKQRLVKASVSFTSLIWGITSMQNRQS